MMKTKDVGGPYTVNPKYRKQKPEMGYSDLKVCNTIEMPFGVLATIDVLYFHHDDDFDLIPEDQEETDYDYDEGFDETDCIDYDNRDRKNTKAAHIFGTITCTSHVPVRATFPCNSDNIVLFRRTCEDSVKVISGDFIELSRSSVSVLGYSSLQINLDLHDRGTQLPISIMEVQFNPKDCMTFKKDIVGNNGRIRIRVTWNDCYQTFNKYSEISEVEGASFSSSIPIPPAMSTCYEPRPKIEVFSIVLCAKDSKVCNFYGKITVNTHDLTLFKNDANSSEECPVLGTSIALKCNESLSLDEEFCLWVTLKDVEGPLMSNGYIFWRRDLIMKPKQWVDRFLCSLIRGDNGFAAVHYVIFYDALSANVKVTVGGITTSAEVYGVLSATHPGPVAPTYYEIQQYRSILFNECEDEGLVIQMPHREVPLLKSVVAAERNSHLYLEANLAIKPENWPSPVIIVETIEFEVNEGSSVRCIEADCGVYLEVTVTFRQ